VPRRRQRTMDVWVPPRGSGGRGVGKAGGMRMGFSPTDAATIYRVAGWGHGGDGQSIEERREAKWVWICGM